MSILSPLGVDEFLGVKATKIMEKLRRLAPEINENMR